VDIVNQKLLCYLETNLKQALILPQFSGHSAKRVISNPEVVHEIQVV